MLLGQHKSGKTNKDVKQLHISNNPYSYFKECLTLSCPELVNIVVRKDLILIFKHGKILPQTKEKIPTRRWIELNVM